ncbi:MAG: histidinol dehydrogenase, partial [Desulfobacterales bacterium]|nr:histidinol dehydrogenase [Desulfobacterales bacterium]
PGLGDEGYIGRRKELFALCRKHRLEGLGPPIIHYTPDAFRKEAKDIICLARIEGLEAHARTIALRLKKNG